MADTGLITYVLRDVDHGIADSVRFSAADEIESLERQIAELRAERDAAVEREREKSQMLAIETHHAEAAEEENARLRALPLKDEVERVLEPFAGAANHYDGCGITDEMTTSGANLPIGSFRAARSLLSRLRAGEQEGWRSMDSAPKDGTKILYTTKFKDIGFCHWDEGYNDDDYPCWWDNERDDEVCPVAWLPADTLPASPSVSEGGSRNG